ncbi:type II toxin-antitoxin system Phd/YefM family antitoxin [Rhizobium sp. TH2]|uniref:type II toxin-antitoxin system Phd/YefM family antitoxin n=1 Tax=Rhizobium sp. TH2 TaxID=2775403 RepID=UPI00215796A2|nr:type II toxin-antitoxin system Phd/YefM family antitoxin [Rhizobium sp. TH2]UVC07168.1 type II toxin-antitoxin system Phd/YefM family antitoxin [Rhizobium sp. TH2]
METVSSTTFHRKTRSLLAAAADGPVIITTRGHETHVLMTAADYEKLGGRPWPHEASKKPES